MDSIKELDPLREKVHDLEKKLQMAAEFGKQLLETNSELTEQQDRQAKEHSVELEQLEQEKYSLQMRIEQKSLMEKALTEELENLQGSVQRQQRDEKSRDEMEECLAKLRGQNQRLQTDHDKLQLSERQWRERTQELEQLLEDTRQQLSLKVSVMNETCGEEVAGLHLELTRLQGDKLDLVHELSDVKAQLEQQQFAVTSAEQQLHSCQSDIEDQRAMASSYCTALEKCRKETQEWRAQMEVLKMEQQNHKMKGNSLFGEVEDRRVEAEKELISMKVMCDSYRKQFEASRQQMHKLKLQMSGLLMMSGRAADGERLESLQRQLSHARSELCDVTEKLHKYETKQVGTTDYLVQYQEEYGDNSTMKYTEYLLLLIERKHATIDDQASSVAHILVSEQEHSSVDGKRKDVESVEAKLRVKELQLMTQGDQLMNSERRNYESQRQLKALQGQNIKLQVRLEELQLKYEPDSLQVSNKVRRVRLEKIALGSSSQGPQSTDSNPNGATLKQCETQSKEPDRATLKQGETQSKETDQKTKGKTREKAVVTKEAMAVTKGNKKAITTVTNNPSKEASKRLPLAATLGTNEDDSIVAVKSTKVRKVTISDKEDVFELSEPCVEDGVEGQEGGEGCQGRQRRGRVCKERTVHVTKDSDREECKTQ